MKTQSSAGFFFSRAFYLLASFLFFIPGIFLTGICRADIATPFLSHDQNPLIMNYGLPLPTPAKILQQDKVRLTTSLSVSNTIHDETNNNESLFIDAETYQLNLLIEYGFKQNWQLRFQLPFVAHNGGFLDSWIDNYHDLFNLSEDIRPLYPIDRFTIAYQLNGQQLIDLQQRTSGLGDISIQLGYQVKSEKDSHLSYWSSLKLPSGDAQKLTGSGSTDLALWLSSDLRLNEDKWIFGNLGLVFMSDSEIMQTIQNNTVLFANAGRSGPHP